MEEILLHILPIALGYVIDLVVGDPHFFPHPVRLIGLLVTKGEQLLRNITGSKSKHLFIAGVVLTLCMISIGFFIPFYILKIASQFNIYVSLAIETIFCYQILATKSLKVESMKVYYALKAGDLPLSRKNLSWIVGRDTAFLNETEIAKAAVETVAENCSDGVLAPMIFLFLGGAPLGFIYKTINTLDSMIGYKNEKYMDFGKFAAKCDDVANYLPARCCAFLMLFASSILGFQTKNGYRIYKRDKSNHQSPNSAHTEAVCAGVLCIQLAGDAYYKGKLVVKPTIGDNSRPVEFEDIKRTNRLMVTTSFLGIICFSIVYCVFLIILYH